MTSFAVARAPWSIGNVVEKSGWFIPIISLTASQFEKKIRSLAFQVELAFLQERRSVERSVSMGKKRG